MVKFLKIVNKVSQSCRRWYNQIKSSPTSPLVEKANILVTGVLAAVSTVLAFLTYNQQQEIKGMSDLLRKQDTLVGKQDKLISSLAKLSIENSNMIKELKISQQLTALQTQAVNNQLIVTKYSSKPLMNKNGIVYLRKISGDILYSVEVGFKNNGYRPADNVTVTALWANIIDYKVFKTSSLKYNFPESFQPGEVNHFSANITLLSKEQISYFQSLYLVLVIEYDDVFVNHREKKIFVGKQYRIDDQTIGSTYVSGKIRKVLENYVEKNKIQLAVMR